MIPLILFVSIVVGVIVFLIALQLAGSKSTFGKTRTQKALSEVEKPAQRSDIPELPPDARELHGMAKTLAEAGIRLTSIQLALLSVAITLTGVLLGYIFFIPGLPSVALGCLMGYVPFFYIKDRAQTRGQRMDKELPITMARISVGLQTGTPLSVIFTDSAKHLPPANPLTAELFRTAQDMDSVGEEVALGKLADRSPSISLANAAMMLQSFARAGGSQFADAVSEAAVNIQRMIEVRNTAQARAAQSMQAAAIVPLILGFVLVSMSADPAIRESFSNLTVQFVIVLVMIVMAFGYLFMRSQVRRVV